METDRRRYFDCVEPWNGKFHYLKTQNTELSYNRVFFNSPIFCLSKIKEFFFKLLTNPSNPFSHNLPTNPPKTAHFTLFNTKIQAPTIPPLKQTLPIFLRHLP